MQLKVNMYKFKNINKKEFTEFILNKSEKYFKTVEKILFGPNYSQKIQSEYISPIFLSDYKNIDEVINNFDKGIIGDSRLGEIARNVVIDYIIGITIFGDKNNITGLVKNNDILFLARLCNFLFRIKPNGFVFFSEILCNITETFPIDNVEETFLSKNNIFIKTIQGELIEIMPHLLDLFHYTALLFPYVFNKIYQSNIIYCKKNNIAREAVDTLRIFGISFNMVINYLNIFNLTDDDSIIFDGYVEL